MTPKEKLEGCVVIDIDTCLYFLLLVSVSSCVHVSDQEALCHSHIKIFHGIGMLEFS